MRCRQKPPSVRVLTTSRDPRRLSLLDDVSHRVASLCVADRSPRAFGCLRRWETRGDYRRLTMFHTESLVYALSTEAPAHSGAYDVGRPAAIIVACRCFAQSR